MTISIANLTASSTISQQASSEMHRVEAPSSVQKLAELPYRFFKAHHHQRPTLAQHVQCFP